MKPIIAVVLCLTLTTLLMAQEIPDLPTPLGAGNAEVWNGQIYHFGGSNNWSGSIVYPRVYHFDGLTWSHLDTIPDKNLWDVETVLAGDYVYLLGGWPSGPSLNRRYDLSTGEWTYMAASPNASQTWGITSEALAGTIYLFNSVGAVFAYEISQNAWSVKTANPASGSWDMSSVLYHGEIYVIGWTDSAFFKYSPANDEWTRLANSPYQVGACAIGIIDDLMYCIGGNWGGGSAAYYKSIIVYNISENSWSIETNQLSSKRHWMATAEYKGGLYVIGGIDSLSLAVSTVEEIVPQGTAGLAPTHHQPGEYQLLQNYPNPFNPDTRITFTLPRAGWTSLRIYNVLGRELEILAAAFLPAGTHTFRFDGKNLSSGIYFYKLEAGPFAQIMKMVLIR